MDIRKIKQLISFLILLFVTFSIDAFTRIVHQNIPEDAFLYLENYGTIQQRWVADYLKAKVKGRSSGRCGEIRFFPTEDPVVKAKFYLQCGMLGVARTGGTAPDFFIDTFWSGFQGFSYHLQDQGLMLNNFSSWSHFINLLEYNQGGFKVVNNVYNDVDGYAYNATWGYTGFPNADWITASVIANSKMTVDLPNCTNSACNDKFSIYPNANPATDYKQNGSITPIGVPALLEDNTLLSDISEEEFQILLVKYPEIKDQIPSKDTYLKEWNAPINTSAVKHTVKDLLAVLGKQLDNGLLTNYNCFSDDIVLPCLTDIGERNGTGYYVRPNNRLRSGGEGSALILPGTYIGEATQASWGGWDLTADQDWVIYEPADNAATFFYNELFLEGGKSRRKAVLDQDNVTLNKENIVGRYYTIVGDNDYNITPTDSGDIKYLSVVQHWVGDMGQMAHIWSTLGYGHGDFEGFADNTYGLRNTGESLENNYENYNYIRSALVQRQHRFLPDVPLYKLMMEQAFRTYQLRFRSGYDYFVTKNKSVWKTNATWGVNNAIALGVLVFEKGVMDLRRCRNNASCNNQ